MSSFVARDEDSGTEGPLSQSSQSSASSPFSASPDTPAARTAHTNLSLQPLGATPTSCGSGSAAGSAFGSPLSTPHARPQQVPVVRPCAAPQPPPAHAPVAPPPISTPASSPVAEVVHHHHHTAQSRRPQHQHQQAFISVHAHTNPPAPSPPGSSFSASSFNFPSSASSVPSSSSSSSHRAHHQTQQSDPPPDRSPDPSPEFLLHVDETPRARTKVRLRVVTTSSGNLPDRSSKSGADDTSSSSSSNRHVAMQRLGFATVVWGFIMIVASLMLLVRTNTPIAAVGGVVGVRWRATGTGDGRRHEIHVPAHRNMMGWDVYKDSASSDRVAVLYSVFGAWHDELTYEFERVVRHVTRSSVLENHEVVLVWETQTHTDLPVHTPMGDPAVQKVLADHPGRVRFVHITTSDAEAVMPEAAFSKGFYYNPEVAAIMYVSDRIADASAKAGRHTMPYDYVWLLESDVRWTGDWEALFLQPYAAGHGEVDLFAFRTSTPWVYKTPGWETSNCFVRLGDYPQGWRARGENATSLAVPWSKRIGCLMPSKRFSVGLLSNLNTTYMGGVGGYNEVTVPTVNDITGGSFGTSSETCMYYSYRDVNAAILYDGFRNRRTDAEGGEDSSRVPCLLHPVKHQRSVKNYRGVGSGGGGTGRDNPTPPGSPSSAP